MYVQLAVTKRVSRQLWWLYILCA